MRRLTTLGVLALLVSTQALPSPQCPYQPLPFLPLSPPPFPSYQPVDEYQQNGQVSLNPLFEQISMLPSYYGARLIPIGDGNVRVSVPNNPISNQLLSIGFQPIRVPGGIIFISPSPEVQVQVPPIGISLPPQPPIRPEPMIIQPQTPPPIRPPSITVRPPPLGPINPPPIEFNPPQLPPISPPPIVIRPPRPEPIQPEPILVRPKPLPPINPPPVIVRPPPQPNIQPPPIVLPSRIFEQLQPRQRQYLNPSSGYPCPYQM